jgi:hypothetical protein
MKVEGGGSNVASASEEMFVTNARVLEFEIIQIS